MRKRYQNKIIYQDKYILKFLIESKKHGNREVVIDVEDWDRVKNYKWNIVRSETKYNHVMFGVMAYSHVVGNKEKRIKLHRFILNITDSKISIDHISGDRFDNRKSNLRICSIAQNNQNRKINKKNKYGYKGIFFEDNKYRVSIQVNYKRIYLGRFVTPEDAARAYNEAAKKYFGEFANLNIILE